MYRARVTSKGQVTIPKDVRDKLGLRQGDELVFRETSEGYVIQKEILVSPFDKYVGKLGHLQGEDVDDLVREMRGD
ncbi:MAG: AbrB/MazE/SpoVT family DNA-binding domain-containing protein [Firmicutes bacterium]|nr:AbrB/MazE/SpoVT family DNA-binding domain-containing protein [Bacillota bacterium]